MVRASRLTGPPPIGKEVDGDREPRRVREWRWGEGWEVLL